jgi:hypothetical protein
MMIRLVEKGTTLTWGPGLSSDPESEAIAAPAAVAVVVVAAVAVAVAIAAAGTPGSDHPWMVVVAAKSED